MIWELWDDLPWYGRVVIFGMIPLSLLGVVAAVLWAVVP
jgi:hypothetical protein